MILRDENMRMVTTFAKARYADRWVVKENEPVHVTYDLKRSSKEMVEKLKREYKAEHGG